MKVSFLVRPDLTRWSCDHGSFSSGERHQITNASAAFVAQIACAEAFGSLIEVSYDSAATKVATKALEPDSESVKRLEKAMADGSWQEGNLRVYEETQAALAAGRAGLELGGED